MNRLIFNIPTLTMYRLQSIVYLAIISVLKIWESGVSKIKKCKEAK